MNTKHILCVALVTIGSITAAFTYHSHQEAESKARFEKRLTAYKAEFTERKNFTISPAIDAAEPSNSTSTDASASSPQPQQKPTSIKSTPGRNSLSSPTPSPPKTTA